MWSGLLRALDARGGHVCAGFWASASPCAQPARQTGATQAWLRYRAPGAGVWAVPGRIKLAGEQVQRVLLRCLYPLAREVCVGLRPLLALSQLPVLLGYIMAADVTSGIAAAEHSETGSGSREPRPTSDAPRCAPSSYPADRPGGCRQ